MVDLVCSLVAQIIRQIPSDPQNLLDFAADRLGTLKGPVAWVPEAIGLLKNYLTVGPGLLFVVIGAL